MYFRIQQCWYRPSLHPLLWSLLPCSWLFRSLVAFRRLLFQFKSKPHFPVPIIVVGNLTVGGTGKTPFTIALAKMLQIAGFHPGIISRGMGTQSAYLVQDHTEITLVGDEAILLRNNTTHCPIVVSRDRVAAVRKLLTQACDVIISDDGLQHYALPRDLEIVMIDSSRGMGNQQLLPAGPLREPLSRLQTVDYVIINERSAAQHSVTTDLLQLLTQYTHQPCFKVALQADQVISLYDPTIKLSLSHFAKNNPTVHAIAAIGNPAAFFNLLIMRGLRIIPHYFKDHHHHQENDCLFADEFPIIMTEKDAVKCDCFIHPNKYWYLKASFQLDSAIQQAILEALHKRSSQFR